MKKLLLIALIIPFVATAQPNGYYTPALGLNGQPLRAALYNIIKVSTQLSYTPDLWNAYYTTDAKPGNKLWDMYSDIPNGTPAYQYNLGSDQCGNGSNHENSCYNREHTWPQSKFGSAYPMQSDLWLVYPTDYYVNNQRGNMPYGKVGIATKTFTNGTKIGNNTYSGAPTTTCFEPIDSFKGDIARSYFYITTRYLGDSNSFVTWEMANKVHLKPWAIAMLLDWHHNDPVSKKEKDRNNAVYALQNNRNPYIDYPQFVDCIWAGADCSSLSAASIAQLSHKINVYPNPVHINFTVSWDELSPNEVLAVDVLNMQGQLVFHEDEQTNNMQSATINTSNWAKGIYLLQLKTKEGKAVKKLIVE